MMTFCVNFY